MSKPNVVAIIQARMGSTRLPGKVLMPLAGKPVLWHIIHRLRKCRSVNVIAVATSDCPQDDPIAFWAAENAVEVVRGSEDNVLERYLFAAHNLNADIILRVTGDAPLIDPELIDHMIELLIRENAEYCVGNPNVDSIHEGFSPFSRTALEKIGKEANDDLSGREHVDGYIKKHPDRFNIVYISVPEAHHISGTRVSVDTPADLKFLNTLYRELGVGAGDLNVTDVVKLLKRRPEMLSMNSHVRQKGMTFSNKLMVIRCDGNSDIGLGHVIRCLAIAQVLRDKHGVGIVFAMSDHSHGPEIIMEAGFPVELFDGHKAESQWLNELLGRRKVNGLLLDIRTGLSIDILQKWHSKGLLIASLDDASDRRLCADLLFYPPVPQIEKLDWSGFSGKRFEGWQWIPLRPEFDRKLPLPTSIIPQIVVTMGGSDPAGLSLLVLEALDQIACPVNVILIKGKAFVQESQLEQVLKRIRLSITILKNVKNMSDVLADADLVIASFGVTAYELAALGIPAILLSLTEDHALSASTLHCAGMADSIGIFSDVSIAHLSCHISKLIGNIEVLSDMRAACTPVDGKGADRIADKINEYLLRQNPIEKEQ